MIDVLLALIVCVQAAYWARIGILRGGMSLLGFIGGMFLGGLLAPALASWPANGTTRLLLALCILLTGGLVVGSLGRIVGEYLARLFVRLKLDFLDATVGAITGASITLLSIWLMLSVVSGTSFAAIGHSYILRTMDQSMPPAPALIARLVELIDANAYPRVFVGLEPQPVAPVEPPSQVDVARALETAGASTVRIEGLGCGGIVSGSGFVAGDGLVVTNAHVVAGIRQVAVVDTEGYHQARPVVFDPTLDIAILRTSDLAKPPLALSAAAADRGTAAVVLGYPGGGPLRAVPAAVLRPMTARGRDIYGERVSVRAIYELQTQVIEGNSGGPLVTPDGRVIGIVFAESVTDPSRGYAIQSSTVIPLLATAQGRTEAADTAGCAR